MHTLMLVLGFVVVLLAAVACALAWRPMMRWLFDVPVDAPPPPPDPGPLVLELDAVYPSGATGAILARLELYEGEEHDLVVVPRDARGVRVRLVHRAGLYAGASTTVDRESEPPPAFLRGGGR